MELKFPDAAPRRIGRLTTPRHAAAMGDAIFLSLAPIVGDSPSKPKSVDGSGDLIGV
ncbi:Uncharacterised protein [Mycobacterium xenopi]|uniref:Uncharacterized protein n=1 Tax=Mycobacterium xenopi TaxID=1789 RepID=A0AAD1LZA5_MYCXE|nr:hypothetical protein MYXE_03910 [Mycobacterium xenopi]SPX79491.1 Uncharacterised protein [Mycobacterium xenopi]